MSEDTLPDVLARAGALTAICQTVYFNPHVLTIGDFAKPMLDLNQTKSARPRSSGPVGVLVFRMS